MDKLDALKMKPILECPNPFMRIKTAINSKEYTQLCHIVLELETYMLEQKKLPTDFDKVAPSLKAALDPAMIFSNEMHVPAPDNQQHHYEAIHPMTSPTNSEMGSGSQEVDMVMNGYNLVERIDRLERNQARAIKKMNAAIKRQNQQLQDAIHAMGEKTHNAITMMT